MYDFLWNLLQDSLFAAFYSDRTLIVRRPIILCVKSVLCESVRSNLGAKAAQRDCYLLQNDLKILAALSLSLSREVGQNASDPIRFENLFTGAPNLSAHCQQRAVRWHAAMDTNQTVSSLYRIQPWSLSLSCPMKELLQRLSAYLKNGSLIQPVDVPMFLKRVYSG